MISCLALLPALPNTVAVDRPAIAMAMALALIASRVTLRRLVTHGDSAEAVTFDEIICVPVLLTIPFAGIFAVTLIAAVLGNVTMRRPWKKAVFNTGQALLATVAGVLAYHALAGPFDNTLDLRHLLAAAVGTIVIAFVSRTLVISIISLATGQPWRANLSVPTTHVLAWLGATVLGASGIVLTLATGWGFVLALFMVLIVQRAYSLQLREATTRRAAERLDFVVAAIRGAGDRPGIEVTLNAAVRELIGAEHVDVRDSSEAVPSSALHVPLRSEKNLVAAHRRGDVGWTEQDRDTLRTLAGVADDALRRADLFTRLQTITNAQNEAVLAFDTEGLITFANPAARDMLGRDSSRQVDGLPVNDVCQLVQKGGAIDVISRMHAGESAEDQDAVLHTRGGQRVEVAYSFAPLTDAGVREGAVLVLRDVTERRLLQDALAHRALHDELTALPNRRLFLDRLDHALNRSIATHVRHGVLFVDVDRFKLINDSFGHLVGDQLLVQLSERLLRRVGAGDTVARLSGDEFILLVEDRTDIATIAELAFQLCEDLRRPYLVGGQTVTLTVSIGVTSTSPGETRDDVMLAADTAAYAAKASGRNCVRIATDELIVASRSRLELEGRLRAAIDSELLSLWYQPIVDTRTCELQGIEALVRWEEPDGTMVLPGEFIPLAEDSGLIVMLGHWVLEEACRTTRRWTLEHPDREPLQTSVNLSALQLAQPQLPAEIADVLARTGLPAAQLSIEITETAVFADFDANVRTLNALRDIGVHVAVDDFGTGYSSLSYLRELPVDTIKLDASFIAGLGKDIIDAEIVGAVLRLCKALGRRTIAEGVETERQRQTLARMGCPSMQGFLVSKPLRAGDFAAYWDAGEPEVNLRLVEDETEGP